MLSSPCIRSSALSSTPLGTLLPASRERCQGRPARRGVHRRPLTPRAARDNGLRDEAKFVEWSFVLSRKLLDVLDQGSSPSIPTVEISSTNHVFDLHLQTMIGSPNSPSYCQGRQGAQST